MSSIRKSLILIPALLFILACQLVSQPFEDVQNGAATAAAFATDIEDASTQITGLATELEDFTTQAAEIGTEFVDLSTPVAFGTSAPALDAWKNIPVMPEAISGQDLGSIYQYTIKATPDEIEKFYRAQLGDQGWDELFSTPYSNGAGMLTFTRDSEVLVVTYSDNTDGTMLIILTIS